MSGVEMRVLARPGKKKPTAFNLAQQDHHNKSVKKKLYILEKQGKGNRCNS